VIALALREPITDDVFDGSDELYWVLVVAVLAYAASYFARGWLAGHQRFGLYGGLVLLESCSRCLFALAVAIGIASGQGVVALGIAAAPLVSLLVVPWAIERRGGPQGERGSMREGAGFAGAVLAIMVAEQALLNGPVIAVDATAADAALAGFVFNVLLITRAPLQLFQAIQTSLLPHLSGITATGGGPEFRHAIRVTVLSIAAFTAAVVVGLGLIGPWAMGVLFGGDFDYARGGLMLVGLGMGFHLTAGTLNQAALARRRGAQAAVAWLASAAMFLIWLLVTPLDDPVLAVEAGYCATTALLAVALWVIEAGAAAPGRSAATAASGP
jgi:O-antigen/teichoic acid export membrane protein